MHHAKEVVIVAGEDDDLTVRQSALRLPDEQSMLGDPWRADEAPKSS